MTISKAMIIERAWDEVNHVRTRGERCSGCSFDRYYPGSRVEPPESFCTVLETGDDPFDCPGVDREDIVDDLAAEAEEAYERSKDR